LGKMGINLNRASMSATRLQFTDEEFIAGLRSGDNIVLSALYKKYYNLVLRFIVNNSGSSEEATDIYQETIIVLYENARNPEFTLTSQLQTYIYSVARRLWLKQLKKNGKTFLFKEEEENELADVNSDLEEHQRKEEELERMQKSLSELGEPCATLINDFYVHRMSMDEIADKFGYTNPDNAKTQKYKCLQRLKRYFFEKQSVRD
jgi:RNA polymerase sigma factor (sigma-70 family)